ncbi:MAG: hypothetical protein A2511_12065 [Deltaproteobacteria bacterium RIFOXYD12_FULL_50_9]|nr:MAG: hypothetical protein A2511_12065 [Deltaproteobacteria bacterium RIFOXYD12_FULL_50_9]
MSSSKIIKLKHSSAGREDVMPPPHSLVEADDEAGFRSFESIWQAASERAEQQVLESSPVWLAEQQAEEIISKAKSEAGRIEKVAHDKGFASGEAKALAEGKRKSAEIAAQFSALFAQVEEQRRAVFGQYEGEIMTLILAMVDRLVNHEVSVNPRVIKACVLKTMDFVVENSSIKIHLNPVDFEHIKEAGLNDPRFLDGRGQVQLIDDPAISMGGCLLETDFGQIDANLENCKETLYKAVEQAFLAALAENNS